MYWHEKFGQIARNAIDLPWGKLVKKFNDYALQNNRWQFRNKDKCVLIFQTTTTNNNK